MDVSPSTSAKCDAERRLFVGDAHNKEIGVYANMHEPYSGALVNVCTPLVEDNAILNVAQDVAKLLHNPGLGPDVQRADTQKTCARRSLHPDC